MTCSKCKHWKKRDETPNIWGGPKILPVGDCYESSFAKTFGKSTTAHDTKACKYFEMRDGE